MTITDAQVHVWDKALEGTSPHRPHAFGHEQLIPLMDQAGVDRVVLIPPSWAADGNNVAFQAAIAHPARFAVMAVLPWDSNASLRLLPALRDQPGVLGIRQTFHIPRFSRWLEDGTAERIWVTAEAAGIPVMVYPPGLLDQIARIVDRHRDLRLVIDHMALPLEARSDELPGYIDELIPLARFPNIAVKLSALPLYSSESPPFRDLHDLVCRVIEAFGPHRAFWGSDFTRLTCTYSDALTLPKEIACLTPGARELVLGRALSEWLGWPP
jgi:L-fuconolactonase